MIDTNINIDGLVLLQTIRILIKALDIESNEVT